MLCKISLLTTILLLNTLTTAVTSTDDQSKKSVDVEVTEVEPNGNDKPVPEFVATNEWQDLLPGQGVPRGLHMRLNLETGKREAKLVDRSDTDAEEFTRLLVTGSDSQETTVTVLTDYAGDAATDFENGETLSVTDDRLGNYALKEDAEHDEAPRAEPKWNHEKIYEVLQALPEPPEVDGMNIHEAHEKLSPAEFRRQVVYLWKKRQAELKEALESLQDDAKYLGKLLKQFKEAEENGDMNGQISVLEVLEWEVQDLDKTHVFNFIGGFSIMADYLNSTSLPVRASAAWVIGSAAKNYKDGQDWAIDAGVIPKLLDSIALDIPNKNDVAKDVHEVKKKSIYALSSIVRSNARGQRLFLLQNGPEQLAGLFDNAHSAKLHLKVLLFMYDLMIEEPNLELAPEAESTASSLVHLKKIFQAPKWCERLLSTFVEMAPDLAQQREVIELVDFMRHQVSSCQQIYVKSEVKNVVKALAKRFGSDEALDAAAKEELSLFFEDFLYRV
ncbi:hypothetical protein CCR75_008874 [Bremia lactucae]|uniref:Nucleotide exchange factor SIL1 n=1 Tax=Bremia lactucae TaxID=4779 RepID=A0A976FPH1_BRELC|nr:hypothetical protein CCR75_008874 [Bremia lactucae]